MTLSFYCKQFKDARETAIAATLSNVTQDTGPGGADAIHLNGQADSFASFGTQIGQFGTSDFTVAFWFKTAETHRYFDLVGNRTSGSHGNFFCVRMTGQHESWPAGTVTTELDQNGSNYISLRSEPTGLNDNNWHHVAVARQSATMKLYIDGTLSGKGSAGAPANVANNHPFKIGRSLVGIESKFTPTASFSDLRVYDTALSAEEIARIARPSPEQQVFLAEITGVDFAHVWAGEPLDRVGGVTLHAEGAPTSGVATAGLTESPVTGAAFQFKDMAIDAWLAPSPDVGDLSGQSTLIAGLFRATAPATNLRGFVGKRAAEAPNPGWELAVNSKGQLFVTVDAGDTQAQSTVAAEVADNAWHVFVLLYDKAANKLSLHTDLASGNTVDIPGDCASPRHMAVGSSRLRTPDCEVALLAIASGEKVQGTDGQDIATRLHQALVA